MISDMEPPMARFSFCVPQMAAPVKKDVLKHPPEGRGFPAGKELDMVAHPDGMRPRSADPRDQLADGQVHLARAPDGRAEDEPSPSPLADGADDGSVPPVF